MRFVRFVPAGLTVALGLFQIGEPSLWVDEAFTARAMGYDYTRLIDELHWVYYTALKPWTSVLGTSEAALRVPSVLGAAVAVTLLYGFARQLAGEPTAFVAALLLSVNPFFVQWSQQARSYSFVVALAIGATWLLVRAIERDRWVVWIAYAYVTVLFIHVQFFAAFLLLPVHVLVGWRIRRAWAAWALTLTLSLPWLVRTLQRGEEGSPVDWLERPGLGDVAWSAAHTSGALGLGLVLALVGLRASSHPLLLGAWAFLPGTLCLIGSIWKPMFLDRYLLVSAPAFALLVAMGLVALSERLRLAAAAAVATATVVGLALWYGPDDGDNWKGENWRAAAAYAGATGGAEVRPDWALPAYTYYGGRQVRTGLVIERAEYAREFAPNADVEASFGKRLRATRAADR